MHTISEATKSLAPGSMLGLLHLGPHDVFRVLMLMTLLISTTPFGLAVPELYKGSV